MVKKKKKSASNAGNPGLIPQLRRSPGKGNDYPLQYSCLENSRDRTAWAGYNPWVTKNQMQLSNYDTHIHTHNTHTIFISCSIVRMFALKFFSDNLCHVGVGIC